MLQINQMHPVAKREKEKERKSPVMGKRHKDVQVG